MPTSPGYSSLQPTYVLGTDQWVSATAEQMVGSDFDLPNQLREHFPFFPIAQGRTIVVPRVAAMATAAFVGNESVQTDASYAKLNDPPEEIVLTSIVGTAALDTFPSDVLSFAIDQLQLQIELKKIAIRIKFWDQFFRPMQPRGFRGLPDLVDPSQIIEPGNPLHLADMDALVARVTEADSEMDRKVITMNSAAFIKYASLVRETGISLDYTDLGGRRYAMHNGVPILVSDFIPGSRESDVWCCTLGMEDKGVYGVVPPGIGDNGLVVEYVQGQLEVDASVHRVRWYTTVILGHRRGLACLKNVALNP